LASIHPIAILFDGQHYRSRISSSWNPSAKPQQNRVSNRLIMRIRRRGIGPAAFAIGENNFTVLSETVSLTLRNGLGEVL